MGWRSGWFAILVTSIEVLSSEAAAGDMPNF